ncbi:DUF262 domain-containing protein [Thiolinea disciformis]|uniref:DUF262 domain-containing protein n=1 Tax=Thiolinea disciformis TaxID=125614 RepID=UPI000377FC56|nr:DUF262 domain-containing protein [Thiolinea disciformis]
MSVVLNNHTKSQQITKKIISVHELLSDSSLSLPIYQRPYKWKSQHVNQLINDIKRHQNKSSYRLGTLVLHEQTWVEQGITSVRKNIVDGQQRTLTLLLIAHALIQVHKHIFNDEVIDQLKALEATMINPQFENDISKNNLYQNYLEISRLASRNTFDRDLIDFLLNKCTFVSFTLQDIAEAFQFFDTQNARGRDLAPHDLLKAYHLREFVEADEVLKSATVAHWENCQTEELADLFAQFLYRIRYWVKGNSARYFDKRDVSVFKGISVNQLSSYNYTESLNIVHYFIDYYNHQQEGKIDKKIKEFPFQLDQTIINGRRFFEMIAHYQQQVKNLEYLSDSTNQLSEIAKRILKDINDYEGSYRTGDRYVRALFDCLLLYYIDRFGQHKISEAIEKIFIWAYSLRLTMYAVSIPTIDNYVLENNLFKIINHSINPETFLNHSLPIISVNEIKSNKVDLIQNLFKDMHYCG